MSLHEVFGRSKISACKVSQKDREQRYYRRKYSDFLAVLTKKAAILPQFLSDISIQNSEAPVFSSDISVVNPWVYFSILASLPEYSREFTRVFSRVYYENMPRKKAKVHGNKRYGAFFTGKSALFFWKIVLLCDFIIKKRYGAGRKEGSTG